MPTFDTPEPISVRIDLPGGEVSIIASDRTDTVVEVLRGDEDDDSTIQVGYVGGNLVVKAGRSPTPDAAGQAHGGAAVAAARRPRSWSLSGLARFLGDSWDSAQVTIELPSGSHVQGEAMAGEFQCSGRLGDCRLRTDYGDIRLDTVGAVRLNTDSGEISVDRVTGPAEITTSSGEIRVNEIDGAALVRNDDGECYLGDVTGDLRLIGTNGDMYVRRAHASVEAKNVYGSVRIGEVVHGSVVLTCTSGDLEVGVRRGTAAWLDVSTAEGSLTNSLDRDADPDMFDETVEIRARSHDGDVTIRRA